MKELTKDQELLVGIINSGLYKKRKAAKELLMEAAQKEDQSLIRIYLDEIKRLDKLINKLDDAVYEYEQELGLTQLASIPGLTTLEAAEETEDKTLIN